MRGLSTVSLQSNSETPSSELTRYMLCVRCLLSSVHAVFGHMPCYAVVTLWNKIFQSRPYWQNYFGLHRLPTDIILFQRVETEIISKACCSSWIFSNMFNVTEIILKLFECFISRVTTVLPILRSSIQFDTHLLRTMHSIRSVSWNLDLSTLTSVAKPFATIFE